MNTTTCPVCGHAIRLAEHPFCPHGFGSVNIEDVTWPGGKWFENMADQPVFCETPADYRRELKARGLVEMVRHIDGSPHTRSWATIDPYTMEAGRILAERQGTTRATGPSEPPINPETLRIAREVFGV